MHRVLNNLKRLLPLKLNISSISLEIDSKLCWTMYQFYRKRSVLLKILSGIGILKYPEWQKNHKFISKKARKVHSVIVKKENQGKQAQVQNHLQSVKFLKILDRMMKNSWQSLLRRKYPGWKRSYINLKTR